MSTTAAPGTASAMLEVAVRNIGFIEGPRNKNPYAPLVGHANHQPWCASFIAACAKRAGVSLPSTSAYTPTMAGGFLNEGTWHSGMDGIERGDIVFFKWTVNGVRRIAHVGVVEQAFPGGVVSIEGNTDAAGGRTGGRVMRQVRRANIAGYGRPRYLAPPGPLLKVGMKGHAVKNIQNALAKGGYLQAKDVDGEFGPITLTALQAAQAENGLPVTGVTDAETWGLLRGLAHGS